MFEADAPPNKPLFSYYPSLTDKTVAVVSIPHSGEDVPDEFWPYLAAGLDVMREDVDFKVNELIDIEALQKAGIAVIVAHVHRVCVDLNRAPDQSVMFWKQNTKGVPLIIQDPDKAATKNFLRTYYSPFFEIYESILKDIYRQRKSPVPVVDLHSMPSAPTEYHMKQNPHQKTYRASFCVSDQHGKTCKPEYISWFASELKNEHYDVAVNDPYIGGYVTTFVNQFKTENIQIEIKRSIYMNEDTKMLVDEKVNLLKPHLTQTLIQGLLRF